MIDRKTPIPGVYKTQEGFLINKDKDALAAYKKNRIKESSFLNMQEDIETLKSDLTEIKELLRGLVK